MNCQVKAGCSIFWWLPGKHIFGSDPQDWIHTGSFQLIDKMIQIEILILCDEGMSIQWVDILLTYNYNIQWKITIIYNEKYAFLWSAHDKFNPNFPFWWFLKKFFFKFQHVPSFLSSLETATTELRKVKTKPKQIVTRVQQKT